MCFNILEDSLSEKGIESNAVGILPIELAIIFPIVFGVSVGAIAVTAELKSTNTLSPR
jgi:hypothetical protein